MFKTHTHYEARCTACKATLRDENLSRYFACDEPLWIDAPADVPALAGTAGPEASWAVVDGKLRCADCTSDGDVVVRPVPTEALAKVTTWTVHCDSCTGAVMDGESGSEAVFYGRGFYEGTIRDLEAAGWTLVETTPAQPELTLVDVPDAPKRTWQVTCPECIAEAAWFRRLAAAAG